MSIINEDFHEVWWIFAPERHPWGGLRLAHFRKSIDGAILVIITGEIDKRRVGIRIWDDIAPREGWVKVTQIPFPSRLAIDAALDAAVREIAQNITREVFDGDSP